MNRFSRWTTLLGAVLVLGTVFGLAACSSNVKSEAVSQAKSTGQFDTEIKAYKSGQFLLDGAVLSSMDLNSHFAYLKDNGELPKSVLLEPSDDSKIRKDHLRYMASMAYTYGFTVFYQHKDELSRIVPTGTTKLKGAPDPNKGVGNDEVERRGAAHNGTRSTRPGYGY